MLYSFNKTLINIDQAELPIKNNIHKNTGKTFDQWIEIVRSKNFAKHGDIMKFLKEEHGFIFGFANFVALKSRGADAASAENTEELIVNNTRENGI